MINPMFDLSGKVAMVTGANTGIGQAIAIAMAKSGADIAAVGRSRATKTQEKIMALGRRYVQYVNKTYRRTGTLWDSRYKSSLIQADAYLLTCQRYIELNPVRADMVDEPAHYRWSSYRSNALGQVDPLLTPHAGQSQCEKSYRALVANEIEVAQITDIRIALQQSQLLGNSRFTDAIERVTGERREVRPRGRPRRGNQGAQAE